MCDLTAVKLQRWTREGRGSSREEPCEAHLDDDGDETVSVRRVWVPLQHCDSAGGLEPEAGKTQAGRR